MNELLAIPAALVLLSCSDGSPPASGDTRQTGDPASSAGDPSSGDPLSGDPSSGDPPAGDPAPECLTSTPGTPPWPIALPHDGDNGVFDASLEAGPTGRLWMSHSSVNGPAGTGHVSTYLSYSDDGGATWCRSGLVNEATDVAPGDRPTEFAALPTHWNHEVSALAYDPAAPADERWILIWHRYLEALDGDAGTEDRRFMYGWIAAKRAATAEGLRTAPEAKLFVNPGYYADGAVAGYNDTIVGPPEKSWVGDATVGQCAFFTEPGILAYGGDLYVSVTCAVAVDDVPTVLLRLDRSGTPTWEAVGSIMTQAEAQATVDATVGPGVVTLRGVSASALFTVSGTPVVSLTPVVTEYHGCWFFDIDLTDASLGASPAIPRAVIPNATGAFFSGMCEYDDAATVAKTVYGEVHTTGVQFRLFGTDVVP